MDAPESWAQGKVETRMLSKCCPPVSFQTAAKIDWFERNRRRRHEHRHATAQQLSWRICCDPQLWAAKAVGTARRWIKGEVDEVVVGGGGTRNRAIMGHLSSVFSPVPVTTFDALGWNSKAFEAVAFALLAYRTAKGQWGNLPAVTGAAHPVLLGAIVPGGLTAPTIRA